MNAGPALLERLAEALADGNSVDWQAVEARCSDGREAAAVANLRLLARLADGAQTQRRVAPAQAGRLPFGLRALRLLALLQASSAVVGFALGARDGYRIPAALPVLVVLACGGAAAVLLRFGRRDARAAHLGLFFLMLAAACSHRASGFLAAAAPGWASLHGALHALAPECFLPYFLWSFVRGFPRVVVLRPLDAFLAWARRVSLACGLALFLAHGWAWALAPTSPERVALVGPLTRWQASGAFWGLVLLLSLPAPFVALRRARDAPLGERRRVAAFASGLVVGLAPLCLLVSLEAFVPSFARAMDAPAHERLGTLAVFGGVLSLPLTCAYAVAAHRVLDVRLALRALARRALIGAAGWLCPALAAMVGARLLYMGRDESLVELASGAQAPLLATCLVATVVLWRWREKPRRALRRLLGPDRPDWRQLLSRFGQELRDTRTAAEVHAALATTALGAVQVERAHVLTRGTTSFEPAVGALRAMPLDSALAAALRVPGGEPLVADPDEPRSVFHWLPETERAWLADGDVRLVLPVTVEGDDVIALLALGPRRDGRAFDHDDRLLLEALASAAALALGRVGGALGQSSAGGIEREALECTACPRVLSEGVACLCGAPLRPAMLPFVLAGKFQLESVLGRGGMGVVYRARDLSLDRTVALKTLPRVNAEAAVRLRAEARTMATLVHPYLASIHGAESWRGLPVLVVEHLDGGTLAERARRPLPLADVLDVGAHLAAALEAMHHKGLLHRDVKPSNVGFTADGTSKLLDFGLARLMAEALGLDEPLPEGARGASLSAPDALCATTWSGITAPGSARTSWAGTLLYMPPEALAGAPAGVAQDLWGLALSLYEALAGRHPLLTHADPDLDAALRAARFPPLRSLCPDCAPALEAFFARALALSPRARWPDAAAFRGAWAATARAASA